MLVCFKIGEIRVQFFLQGKLLGSESFLSAALSQADCAGRALYSALLTEVIPRALLSSLGLAKELLGISGGGQFLLVLPGEFIPPAGEFLDMVDSRLRALSGGHLRLLWSATENLGDWSVVRKRLFEPLDRRENAPGFDAGDTLQQVLDFSGFFEKAPTAKAAGWDVDSPTLVQLDEGQFTWPIAQDPALDTVQIASHYAPAGVAGDSTEGPAAPAELALRAAGRKSWGILRGDVDNFIVRVRRAESIEEHIQLCVFFKQFLAGELQIACSIGDFWQKVSILYTGGDDFAVYGAWDSLILLAREIQRLFHRSAEEFLKEMPGPEGKTISMALALAPAPASSLGAVFAEAGHQLEIAKSLGKDSFSFLGRVVDWKQLAEAAELKSEMVQLIETYHCSPEFLGQLGGFYRQADSGSTLRLNRTKAGLADRPWRFYRRLSRLLEAPPGRDRDFQKVRNRFLGEFIGKNQAHVKLRPSGRVALEWARLAQEA